MELDWLSFSHFISQLYRFYVFIYCPEDLTITAEYNINLYTVTFDAGELGTIISGNSSQTISHGNSAVEPTVDVENGYKIIWPGDFQILYQT